MASTIITKNSSTATAVPAVGDLQQGELAVNVTDKKVYTKDSSAAIVRVVGSLGNQEANAVAITGGTVTGITDLAVADGGTGASTAASALNNLLPSQTSNANKYLQTDGTNATWDAISISTADITGTLPVANGGTGVTSSTGTGNVVLSNSPTLVTPALGTPASGVATNLTGLPISTGVSGLGTGVATFLGTPSSANLISAVTDETGTGSLVFATSPTLVTPALGTPSALVGTNITGTASGLTAGNVTTNANLTGAVTSVGNATSLGSFTSSQLAGALTDETGSGANVFATSPTLVTPVLGVATATSLQGIIGNVTPAAGAFTTLDATGVTTLQAGTAALPALTTTGDTNTGIFFPTADIIATSTGGSERLRIDSAGKLLLGTTTAATAAAAFTIGWNPTGGTNGSIVTFNGTVQSGVTSSFRGYYSNPSTQATAFTLTTLYHFYANQGTIGAGSTVSNQYGFFVDSTLTGAATNFGYYSGIASGTGRWNFYAGGTADNYFAGNVGIGTSSPTQKLQVVGNVLIPSGNWFGFGAANERIVGDSTGFMQFFANGTERIRIDTAGNVGIATTTPTQKLQVVGNVLVSNGAWFGFGDADERIVGDNSGFIQHFVSGSEQMRLTSTGLGIGTSSPVGRLSVLGTTDNTTQAVISGTIGTTARGLRIATSLITANNDGAILDAQSTTGTPTLIFQTASTERARISSSGMVISNVGTTLDTAKLTIACTAGTGSTIPLALQAGVDSDGYGMITFRNQTGNQGNIICNTSSISMDGLSGITFKATQVASAGANTLDDYEEGTWTPAQGSGLTVVGAYSSSGQYTKIGRSVTVFGEVAGATSVACTANGQICTGLPFAPNTEFQGALINGARSFSNNIGALASSAVQNSTVIAATSKLSFTITYFV